MRMLQLGGDLDLVQEPLGTKHSTEFRLEHLDRDIAVMLEIVREVHGDHAALTEFAAHAVAVAQ